MMLRDVLAKDIVRQYTFPESIRQQTRRRGSIAKVPIYAKLHVKFKDDTFSDETSHNKYFDFYFKISCYSFIYSNPYVRH